MGFNLPWVYVSTALRVIFRLKYLSQTSMTEQILMRNSVPQELQRMKQSLQNTFFCPARLNSE